MSSNLIINCPKFYCHKNPKTETRNCFYKDSIRVRTLDGSKLRISHWSCDYNASGGRATGKRVIKFIKGLDKDFVTSGKSSMYEVDLETVHIPQVNSTTATIHGWAPFPPFMAIDVVPELLRGFVFQDSGKLDMELRAKFLITVGDGYKAPPLHVDMALTSEELKGASILSSSIRGKRLSKDGKCTLVGVARVDPVADPHINALLCLPSECLALINFAISFS